MKEILLAPPVAFVIYLALVGLLSGLGRVMAPASEGSAAKTSGYASGEASSMRPAVPGYRSFFVIALFFAVVHLGVLVLGTSDFSSTSALYIVGLILALLALILG